MVKTPEPLAPVQRGCAGRARVVFAVLHGDSRADGSSGAADGTEAPMERSVPRLHRPRVLKLLVVAGQACLHSTAFATHCT